MFLFSLEHRSHTVYNTVYLNAKFEEIIWFINPTLTINAFHFYIPTVHIGIIKVFYYSPTNAQVIVLKTNRN